MTFTLAQVSVSHGQIAVFDSALERPFNDWDAVLCEQGFSWRPGSVSFRMLDEGGQYTVEVAISEDTPISPEAVRVIQTPFEVPASGEIEIASISDSVPLALPSGMYALRFECFPISNDWEGKVRFVFVKAENPSFAILRADAEIRADRPLLVSASPA